MSERIDQLPHQSDTQPSMLVMIGDPATGKLYRITIAELLAELQFPEGNGDVEAEAAIRSAADIALQNAINQEAINRINGDNNEANQRINGDNNLQLNINAEANARGVADGILQNAITNEINARQQADNDLQQQIDDLELAAGASIDDTTPSTSKVYSSQKTQDLLDTKLDSSAYNDRFKGKYTTLAALQSAHPTANAGDYAQVDTGAGNDVINYNYDTEDGWVEGGSGSAATTTDELPEGSTNLYFTDARARNATKEIFERTTSASAVTISNTTTVFNIDPATTTASQTVTLPASPADLQIVKIVFGGTITSGAVVTALTIAPNSGQNLIGGISGEEVKVGDALSFVYENATKNWYTRKGGSGGGGSIPPGGTTGQVLKKNSSTDYDTSWQNEGSGEPHTYTNDPATSSSATIPDFEGIHLYNINPENTVATLSRKLPENPENWDSVTLKFGGDITSGVVVTAFTLTADQDVLLNPAASAIEARAGDVFEFVFYGGVWYSLGGKSGDSGGITIKGEYANNTAALGAGLDPGDVYSVPIQNDISILAVVKSPEPLFELTIKMSSTSPQTDYPVSITIHNTGGSNTPQDIYLDGKVDEKWRNLRFVNESNQVIPFAVISSNSTSISVVFNVTLNGSVDYKLQYNLPIPDNSITKIGITSDQHYDPLESYCGRDNALVRLGNFKSRMEIFNPDMILQGGDMVGSVTTGESERISIMNDVTDAHKNTALSIDCPHYIWGWGNHDFEGMSFAAVKANFATLPGLVAGNLYGTWDDEHYTYISLDAQYNTSGVHLESNQGYGFINSEQLTWLTNTLGAATKPCIILCHQMLGESDTQRILLTNQMYHVDNRQAVRTILENSGKVMFVLQGHTHMTSYCNIKGIPYLTMGDLNLSSPNTLAWKSPAVHDGCWGIIEIDRVANVIRFVQENQVSGVVNTVYDYRIPFKTIYNDYGQNAEKVFAMGYGGSYGKSSIVSDSSDWFINNRLWMIAKNATAYDGDPVLSDKTIKFICSSNAPNYGRATFGTAIQTGIFRMRFKGRVSSISRHYIKMQQRASTNVAVDVAFMPSGKIGVLNGSTNTPVQDYVINTWYDFDILVDVPNGKYTVKIDGIDRAVNFNFAFTGPNTPLGEFEITSETGVIFIENIRIEKYQQNHPVVNEVVPVITP